MTIFQSSIMKLVNYLVWFFGESFLPYRWIEDKIIHPSWKSIDFLCISQFLNGLIL